MARRRKGQHQVAGLLAAVKQTTGRGIHSLLYRWLSAHHDQIADALHRPLWDVVATWLVSQNIRDGFGKPPSAAIARRTWRKVRSDLAAARADATVRPSPPAADELAPGVRVMPSAAPLPAVTLPAVTLAETGSPPARMTLDIRPARARADLPEPAMPPAPALPAAAPMSAKSVSVGDTPVSSAGAIM